MASSIKFDRWVEARPAFDKRHPDPTKNYGIHGVDLTFYLRGPRGVIQFVIYTNWHLPHVRDEMLNKSDGSDYRNRQFLPFPADVGRHSPVPCYDGEEPMSEGCELLGGKCYYDGSALYAEKVFDKLVQGGHEAMWEELERTYERWLPTQ